MTKEKTKEMIQKRMAEVERRVEKLSSEVSDLHKKVFFQGPTNIKCPKCGYEWLTKSKRDYVNCPNCRSNVKNVSSDELESDDSEFNPFEGKRYEDYDDKDMKKWVFRDEKSVECQICGAEVEFENSYYGFNKILCKNCYIDIERSNHEAVKKMVKRI